MLFAGRKVPKWRKEDFKPSWWPAEVTFKDPNNDKPRMSPPEMAVVMNEWKTYARSKLGIVDTNVDVDGENNDVQADDGDDDDDHESSVSNDNEDIYDVDDDDVAQSPGPLFESVVHVFDDVGSHDTSSGDHNAKLSVPFNV